MSSRLPTERLKEIKFGPGISTHAITRTAVAEPPSSPAQVFLYSSNFI